MIFSDESKFNIFRSDGARFVWRKQFRNECEKFTFDCKIRWWFGIGNLVFIDGILNKYKYLNILKNNLKENVAKLKLLENCYFQQNNDPKHTAKIIKEWLLYNTLQGLNISPQSGH